MNKRDMIGLAAFVALLAAGGASVLLPKMFSAEAKFLTACDEVIQDRLKSPSSYKRISATEIRRQPASLHEYMGNPTPDQVEESRQSEARDKNIANTNDILRKAFRNGEHEKVSTLIEYDADNSYGTALRGVAECFVVVRKGESPARTKSFTYVDGYTPLGWSLKVLRGG